MLRSGRGLRVGSMEVLVGILLACALSATMLRNAVLGSAALSTAGTVFCGVFVQAVPFLALGVVVSGLIAVFVSPERSGSLAAASSRGGGVGRRSGRGGVAGL